VRLATISSWQIKQWQTTRAHPPWEPGAQEYKFGELYTLIIHNQVCCGKAAHILACNLLQGQGKEIYKPCTVDFLALTRQQEALCAAFDCAMFVRQGATNTCVGHSCAPAARHHHQLHHPLSHNCLHISWDPLQTSNLGEWIELRNDLQIRIYIDFTSSSRSENRKRKRTRIYPTQITKNREKTEEWFEQ
jgi:hypothetical protein